MLQQMGNSMLSVAVESGLGVGQSCVPGPGCAPPTGCLLLAAAGPGSGLMWLGSLMLAAGAGLVGWWIITVLWSEDLQQTDQWRYDVSRINELRRADRFYRLFQPAIGPLAWVNRRLLAESLPAVGRDIQVAGLPRFWLAEEYLAKLELIVLFLLPVYVYAMFAWVGPLGLLMAAAMVPLTIWLLRYRLAARAAWRLRLIKRRLPFLLDLLTLLMEAGSTFLGALTQAVEEFRDHPAGEEFGRVLADINLGKTRTEALVALRERMADDEITSIVGSIIHGEQLGTPLARVFRTQADVLRLKRSQRAERIAGEAGVNMLLPGVLVMAAAVLIIVGPFLLNYLQFGWSL